MNSLFLISVYGYSRLGHEFIRFGKFTLKVELPKDLRIESTFVSTIREYASKWRFFFFSFVLGNFIIQKVVVSIHHL